MVQHSLMPLIPQDETEPRWFSSDGCVVAHADYTEVFVGGTLVGRFSRRDAVQRNLLLVCLSEDRRIKQVHLAQAFSLTVQQVWKVRRLAKQHGIDALFGLPGRGGKSLITPRLHKKISKAFDAGKQVGEVHKALMRSKAKGDQVSYRSICRVRSEWLARQVQAETAEHAMAPEHECAEASEVNEVVAAPLDKVLELELETMSSSTAAALAGPAVDTGTEENDGTEDLETTPLHGGQHVQHVGGWLLLSMVHALGLHAAVQQEWDASVRWRERLRVVLDAVVLALGLGQRCVEGVRRLRTPCAGVLLRAQGAPTESWTRRILKHYLSDPDGGGDSGEVQSGRGRRGQLAQMRMMQIYLERARLDEELAAVFYVDNHMRPYTGKYTIRKGWRMQDKRAKPGASDYYVHDEDGRPVFRFTAPEHDSLSRWLSPVTQTLREALGRDQRILLAFDRAGAFPEAMSSLRNKGFEFVTYERKPYPMLSKPSFTEQLVTEDGEVIGVHDKRRKNLGKGRGRVRRIALKMADGHQVNLLAVSKEPVQRLVEVMLGRWIQENAFKHGIKRWGINQLDGRQHEPYPPETVVPNPARRRLDHAMKLARNQEGRARNKLARLAADDPKRTKYEQALDGALLDQRLYQVFRAIAPMKAPLCETELAGKLVKHKGDYKALLDTIRIACANAESELSLLLAPHLRRPREAKKALANVFAAPGAVRVNHKSVTVTLQPAGTPSERLAFAALFDQVNRLGLSLPGDPEARRLRFQLQL
jgi:hypothetical protein